MTQIQFSSPTRTATLECCEEFGNENPHLDPYFEYSPTRNQHYCGLDMEPYCTMAPLPQHPKTSHFLKARADHLRLRKDSIAPRKETIYVFVGAWKVENLDTVQSDIQRLYKVNSTSWRRVDASSCFLRSNSPTSAVLFKILLEKSSDLPFHSSLMQWITVFGFSSLRRGTMQMWHATESAVWLRLALLASMVEIEPKFAEDLHSDHRMACIQIAKVYEVFKNPEVQKQMRMVLNEEGFSKLVEEMERIELELNTRPQWDRLPGSIFGSIFDNSSTIFDIFDLKPNLRLQFILFFWTRREPHL